MEKETDLYKDTPVRYLGYANEIGEAFRGFIGTKLVNVSYGIATLYVVADTLDKATKAFKLHSDTNVRTKKTLLVATDTLIWQMLASVIIPGFTINRVCAFSNFCLERRTKFSAKNRQVLVTVLGISIIPFIIKPIDYSVDKLLDNTFRKFIK